MLFTTSCSQWRNNTPCSWKIVLRKTRHARVRGVLISTFARVVAVAFSRSRSFPTFTCVPFTTRDFVLPVSLRELMHRYVALSERRRTRARCTRERYKFTRITSLPLFLLCLFLFYPRLISTWPGRVAWSSFFYSSRSGFYCNAGEKEVIKIYARVRLCLSSRDNNVDGQ